MVLQFRGRVGRYQRIRVFGSSLKTIIGAINQTLKFSKNEEKSKNFQIDKLSPPQVYLEENESGGNQANLANQGFASYGGRISCIVCQNV